MRLSDEEQAMLVSEMGPACRWAIDHQLQVGRMFDAAGMVPISHAHMMADPKSLGEAGVGFIEELAKDGARVTVPMINDPRGLVQLAGHLSLI
tara:strand:+ start:146 stop:424 length:279 start_codon:yes stop_codon:yes gene_type:complete